MSKQQNRKERRMSMMDIIEEEYQQTIDDLRAEVAALKEVQRRHPSNEPPNHENPVLFTLSDDRRVVGCYCKGGYWSDMHPDALPVVEWRELPPLPEVKS